MCKITGTLFLSAAKVSPVPRCFLDVSSPGDGALWPHARGSAALGTGSMADSMGRRSSKERKHVVINSAKSAEYCKLYKIV